MVWSFSLWASVGGVALFLSLLSIFVRGVDLTNRDTIQIVGGLGAIILWVLFAINGFAVEHTSQCGLGTTKNYESLSMLGVAAGVTMLADLIYAIMSAFKG